VFADAVVSQIWRQNPTLSLFLRNARRASGGVSPYTQPVTVGRYVNSAWMGPGGGFELPPDIAATVNAQFNICALATPVTSMGLEQLVTQDAIAVTSRLMLKMNDLKNSTVAALTQAIFGSAGGNVLQMFGFNDAYNNVDGAIQYGGLSRVTYPDWQGRRTVIAAAPPVATMSREGFIRQILGVAQFSGGEAPDFGVLNIADWTALMSDFLSLERYNNDPSTRWGKDDPVNSGFRGLLLGDTPLFFDLNVPAGTAYLFNSKYITLVVHQDANFAWTGWYSTIPQGQISSVGLSLTALNLVCSKPKTGSWITFADTGTPLN
jgi:hypothetical protein